MPSRILYERQFNTALTTKPGRSGANTSSVNSTSSVGTPDSLAEFRFEYESQITDILRERFEDLGIEGDVTDYVCPRGYTSDFHSSAACASFRELYKQQGRDFNLSRYAIVMDYCDATLKDLLERLWYAYIENGAIQLTEDEDRVPGGVKAVNLLGYNLLNRLTFRDRIRAVLPYVSGLCQGLSLVHAAEQTHHDLKPANIFIKYGHLKFDVKLGDFSFAAPAIARGTNVTFLRDAIRYWHRPLQITGAT